MLNAFSKDLLKSIALKAAFGILAVIVDTLSANMGGFHLDPAVASLIGVVLGEISQVAHAHYDLGGRIAAAIVPKRFRS